ncbi:phosphate ABC transporter substrate-binding protein [Anopheles sinensis]|uniref:Phosphate ABC transporter substrate-binding protein n=1 Tax=Anopheles sinensis TaxID=74873 RepID=A0A084WL19_ANOSI|nr:phosphate ABC transporter substrate-binding protein [Anopheles sinensis]
MSAKQIKALPAVLRQPLRISGALRENAAAKIKRQTKPCEGELCNPLPPTGVVCRRAVQQKRLFRMHTMRPNRKISTHPRRQQAKIPNFVIILLCPGVVWIFGSVSLVRKLALAGHYPFARGLTSASNRKLRRTTAYGSAQSRLHFALSER